jgi:methyl-accepting chemotaxis protein
MSMDEGTQQNAALVEQATAAAQSLNEQAASLTQMMARFQVGSDTRSPTAHAPSAPSKAASKAPSRAPSVERRGPNRAFAKAPAKPAAKSAAAAAPANAASGGGDADWQEF